MNTKIKSIAALACGVVACGLSQSAHASPNLVVNGGFESTSSGVGELGYNTDLTGSGGWTYSAPNDSYDFIFNASHKDGSGNVTATGQSSSVGLYKPASTSPAGGNFLAVDPDYQNGPNNNGKGLLSETISGLTVGDTYTLSFYWAASQQVGYSGATTEGWDFGLGTSAEADQTTGTVANASKGFVPWMTKTYDYTATSTTEILSFMAIGTGGATLPPFDLLDGVSLTQKNNVPDSSSTAGLLGLGIVAMGVAAGFRRFARA